MYLSLSCDKSSIVSWYFLPVIGGIADRHKLGISAVLEVGPDAP